MKKLLAFAAVVAIAVQAQAATISWGLGADVYLMKAGEDYTSAVLADDANAPEVAAGSYLALVYLGQGVDTFNISDITDASVVDTSAYAIDTSMGGVDYDPFVKDTIVSATTYADGASFGVVWYDAGSSKFDYIYSIDDGSAFNEGTTIADMTRGSANISPAESTQGWGGVIAVPEPATAALALLGLGMLLKRRRA